MTCRGPKRTGPLIETLEYLETMYNMKILMNCLSFIVLTNQVNSDNSSNFHEHILGEIRTLKEDNIRKDNEIASLKLQVGMSC